MKFPRIKFVVWYVEPAVYFLRTVGKSANSFSTRHKRYLSRDPHDGIGVYPRDIKRATKFATKAEAFCEMATYDGSPDIEKRTGVRAVIVWE